MYDINQLKEEIIAPTLRSIGMYNPQAVNLLVGTMAQESILGRYFVQNGSGPALGAYQMEPNTHDDILKNYVVYRPVMMSKLNDLGYHDFHHSVLKYDIRYATIFARLHYKRVPEKLPVKVSEMAVYWKEYYNTKLGKGTEQEFIDNYQRYVK